MVINDSFIVNFTTGIIKFVTFLFDPCSIVNKSLCAGGFYGRIYINNNNNNNNNNNSSLFIKRWYL